MRKIFLIALITFVGFTSQSFTEAKCCSTTTVSPSICQKACHNIFSVIALDLSILSPRAAAADIHTCMPKFPCCCPKKSMTPEEKQETIVTSDNEQNTIIPVADKKELKPPCASPQDKKSFFRIDLFRIFKLQIL